MGFDDVARSMKHRHGVDPKGELPRLGGLDEPGSAERAGRGIDLDALREQMQRAERRDVATRQLVLGGILLLGGILVTVLTRDAAASRGGGSYIVAYGPMIWGFIQIVRGIGGVAEG